MNLREYLLNIVMEESCEIALAASKCKRFTEDHKHYADSNFERLQTEITDLVTALKMLSEYLGRDISLSPSADKEMRIKAYMAISCRMGMLDDTSLEIQQP